MPDQMSGTQFVFLFCGMVFVVFGIPFLIAWRQLNREKLPPYDKDS